MLDAVSIFSFAVCKRKCRGGKWTVILSHSQHTLRENENEKRTTYMTA